MKYKPNLPDPHSAGSRRRGRPPKSSYSDRYTAEQLRQGYDRITTILSKHPLTRSINNHFHFKAMAKTFGQEFTIKFLKKIGELYRAKAADQTAALSIQAITQLANRFLGVRIKQINQTCPNQKIQSHSIHLCHTYLLLAYLYRHDDPYLKINKRVFWSYTELEPEEANYIAQLWARGFGHNFIASNLGIEISRVRPLYRSLEEVSKNLSRTSQIGIADSATLEKSCSKLVNQLYQYIRKNAQEIILGEHKMYVIKKQELDNEAFKLEQDAALLSTKQEISKQEMSKEVTATEDIERLPVELMDDELMSPQAPSDIIDPLAEESYGVTSSPASMLGDMSASLGHKSYRDIQESRDVQEEIEQEFKDQIDTASEKIMDVKERQELQQAEEEKARLALEIEKEQAEIEAIEMQAELTKDQFPSQKVMDRLPETIPDEIKPDAINPRDDNKSYTPDTESGKKLSDLLSR